jgi:Kef-type K+ transport system membrane component KefB
LFVIESQALALGFLLLFGYFGGQIVKRIRIPAVAGYVLAGVLLGPSFLNVIPDSMNQSLGPVKDLGLGMVALLIGAELVWKKIRKLGQSIIVITIVQVITTFVLVYGSIRYLLHQPFVVAVLLASLATVTTPVATMAVIREYRAKGPFTTTLMGVIALDDVFCIIAVGISVGLILSMGTETQVMQWIYLIPPVMEVVLSLLSGVIIGVLGIKILQRVGQDLEIMAVLIGIVFVNAGLAAAFDLSALLITMTCGVIISNFYSDDIFRVMNFIDVPILIAFFTLAGAGLHLDVLISNWTIAAFYIVFRVFGKVGGCYLGGHISNAEENVKRHLGTAMLTKAGLSLGLLIYVQQKLQGVEIGALLVAVELAAISFYEIVGPICVRYALFKVGEAQVPESRKATVSIPVTQEC